MSEGAKTVLSSPNERLFSLDFYRGAIMVFLVLESALLYEHLNEIYPNPIIEQFFHHEWNGLRFWDLIQPGFMFIAGTSMALSLNKQWSKGVTWNQSFTKHAKRCGWLFFWGVLNYAVRPNGLSFELWNVLTQLSFTLMVAFLIFRWKVKYQIGFSLGLLLLTEILYRFTNVEGFDHPFTDQHNFGNYVDLLLMNKINGGGWVAINVIPTAAHTIWGAVVGKIILDQGIEQMQKVKYILIAAIIGLASGYLMDWTSITPIIKRISTSSFVLASGGWCLLGLALSYWWIDLKDNKKNLKLFTIVGMNPIFIYLFFEIVGHRWFNDYIMQIATGVMGWFNSPHSLTILVGSAAIFSLEWGMCWFLYKKKIFFKV